MYKRIKMAHIIDIIDFWGGEIETIMYLIIDRRLKEAIAKIEAMAAPTNDWNLKAEIETLKTSYNLMLDYDKKGYKDPNLSEQYAKFVIRTYELLDWARVASADQHASKLYNKTRKKYQEKPGHSFEEIRIGLESYTEDMATAPILYPDEMKQAQEIIAIKSRHEEYLNELFEKVWTSPLWNKETETQIMEILHSVIIPVNDICVLVSAVTMAAVHWFDIRKYLFLINAYQHEDPMINQRAIVGLAMLSDIHHDRIVLYPQARFALEELKDDPSFIPNLYSIQMQILLTRETGKIDDKMKNEIIPKIMMSITEEKNDAEDDDKRKYNEEDGPERNPLWDSWMKDSMVEKYIRELEDLQKAGADMYMGAFGMLKHYPFFQKISHWFYPFDIQYSELNQIEQKVGGTDSALINLMLNSDLFCNSDKYSICFNLLAAPSFLQQEMIKQFNEQSEALSEEQQEMINEKILENKNAQHISRQYIHDLYRFYKLWKYKDDEFNVFDKPFNLWNNADFKEFFKDETMMKNIADFLLDKGYYSESVTIFQSLVYIYNTNVEYYQKCGYALEREHHYSFAIDYYKDAELLKPDDPWTIRRIAICYMKKIEPDKALEQYNRLKEISPDDLRISMGMGRCLVDLCRYEEALPYFFKVEYLSKEPLEARRAIAWCYLLMGKTEEAQKYSDMVLEEKHPSRQDWMNAGHIQLVLDHTEKAIEYYKKAVEVYNDFEMFISDYHEDMKELISLGVSEEKTKFLPDELL